MNLLAIDYGTKNIGLAINNGTEIAFPFSILLNNDNVINQIKDICNEELIEKIILGLPTKMNSSPVPPNDNRAFSAPSIYKNGLVVVKREEGRLANEIRKFKEKLEEVGLNVVLEDELLSSSVAKDKMAEYKEKYEKDAIEASVILQSFLDKN